MKRFFLLVALLSLALTALLGAAPAEADHSPVIFPQQKIPLRFFHDKHLAMELECTFCHTEVPNSTESSDNNLPHISGDLAQHQNVCIFCHQIFAENPAEMTPRADCEACHVGAPEAATIPEPNLIFNHKKHLDLEIRCQTCHKGIEEVELATRENLPRMDDCLQCHDGKTEVAGRMPPAECTTCHMEAARGLVETRFEEGMLTPKNHGELWEFQHKPQAELGVAFCETCHQRDWCLDCHDGTVKPEFHPNDWVSIHPKAAYTNQVECAACHELQVECQDCHERLGVSREVFFGQRRIGRQRLTFHPQGWAFQVGPEHHSNSARRNITACAACHQEQDCLNCHATQPLRGAGFNPHPPGFTGDSFQRRNDAVCLKCHLPGTF